MHTILHIFVGSVFVFFSHTALCQQETTLESSPIASNILLPRLSYGVDFPFSDFKTRFGTHFDLAFDLGYLTKNNLYFEAGYGFLFGNGVKEDILSNLRTIEGGIIGRDMQFADVQLRMRGAQFNFQAGYLFAFGKNKNRTGILATAGGGVLRHKVRIQDENQVINQILDPYQKGYDRLTEGFCLHQSIGYFHLSADRMLNFYVGLDFMQGFTSNVRGYNYNQQRADTDQRTDISMGGKVGWIIPIYLSRSTRYY